MDTEGAERARLAAVDLADVAQRRCEVVVRTGKGVPAADGDPARLFDAAEQLLRNALAFCGPGGRVTVRIGGGPGAYLSIEDDGAGIPPDELPFVLGRFFRGRYARDQAVPGVGLGLAIVRRIALAHGGDLTITSHGPAWGHLSSSRCPSLRSGRCLPKSPGGRSVRRWGRP